MSNNQSQNNNKNAVDQPAAQPAMHSDIFFEFRDDLVDELMDAASSVYRKLFATKSAEEPTLTYEEGHVWIGLS